MLGRKWAHHCYSEVPLFGRIFREKLKSDRLLERTLDKERR
jgi:hypothetical protein